MSLFSTLPTPSLLLDVDRLDANIETMQRHCDAHGVELWPHNKTHKMVEVARRQLAAGAAGLVCAKISEAEALLPADPRAVFIAHSLCDPLQIPRLQRLAANLERLIVACTSEAHAAALEALLAAAGLRLPVMMAVDTGLHREGVRDLEAAVRLARLITAQPHLELYGLYTHEGQLYGVPPAESVGAVRAVHARLLEVRTAVQPFAPAPLELWPGCSVSAWRMAELPDVDAVRPGAYVCGDLSLAETTSVMPWDDVAITVLATVVDRPEPGLALIDAGSKVFSSDKTPLGLSGRDFLRRDIAVVRCNEEHGYLNGADVDALRIGDRVRLVPAHVCTTINLADAVTVVRGDEIVDRWKIDARGCVW